MAPDRAMFSREAGQVPTQQGMSGGVPGPGRRHAPADAISIVCCANCIELEVGGSEIQSAARELLLWTFRKMGWRGGRNNSRPAQTPRAAHPGLRPSAASVACQSARAADLPTAFRSGGRTAGTGAVRASLATLWPSLRRLVLALS